MKTFIFSIFLMVCCISHRTQAAPKNQNVQFIENQLISLGYSYSEVKEENISELVIALWPNLIPNFKMDTKIKLNMELRALFSLGASHGHLLSFLIISREKLENGLVDETMQRKILSLYNQLDQYADQSQIPWWVRFFLIWKDLPVFQHVEHHIHTSPLQRIMQTQPDVIPEDEPETTEIPEKEAFHEKALELLELAPIIQSTTTENHRVLYFSKVYVYKSGHKIIVMYTKNRSERIVPRLLYKSQSDGTWRSAPEVTKFVTEKNETYFNLSKGSFHYTQESKVHYSLLPILEALDNQPTEKSDTTESILSHFDNLKTHHKTIYTFEISETRNMLPELEIFWRFMPGNCFKSLPEGYLSWSEYIETFSFDAPQVNEFFPEISNAHVVDSYVYSHTIAGETRVYIFSSKFLGVNYHWHLARAKTVDNQTMVWIEQIVPANAEITSYGTYNQVLNSGWLTQKPYEYLSILGALKPEEMIPLEDYKKYASLQPLLIKIPLLQSFLQFLNELEK